MLLLKILCRNAFRNRLRSGLTILGVAVASMGLIQAPDSEGRVVVRVRDGNYRKLVISRDRIVGAVLVGDVSEAGPIAMLIRRGLTLSELQPFDPFRQVPLEPT